MAAEPQLDAAGSPRKGRVIFVLLAVLTLGSSAFAQDHPPQQARLVEAQNAFDAGRWDEALRLAGCYQVAGLKERTITRAVSGRR